jgi:23S rRNA pseudouridine1911/1915/1917 synthase
MVIAEISSQFFTAEQNGQRLDIFLAQNVPSVSRSQVKRMIEEGAVLVNGLLPKPSQILKEGDVIRLDLKPPKDAKAVAQEIPLNIVYEDEEIIVVNKEAGMVVHPAPGNYDRTLVNALLFHCRNLSGIGGVLRPGIVHRLDKGTSGLMVAAKTDAAHRHLTEQFQNHEVYKTYQALVWGDVKGSRGEIILPVGRHPGDRKKMSTKSKRGRDAVTLWNVEKRYGFSTLLNVDIKTGRTHQIRVHLADRGYPVMGDTVYGNASKIKTITDAALKGRIRSLERQALHAAGLSFIHPKRRERVFFTAPLPADMADLCRLFEEKTIS